jgi:hypothetical protein
MAGMAPLPTRDVSANALWFPGAYLCTARRFRPFRLTFRAVDSHLLRLGPRPAKSYLSCRSHIRAPFTVPSRFMDFQFQQRLSTRNLTLTRSSRTTTLFF